jgi:hypothetical protein
MFQILKSDKEGAQKRGQHSQSGKFNGGEWHRAIPRSKEESWFLRVTRRSFFNTRLLPMFGWQLCWLAAADS